MQQRVSLVPFTSLMHFSQCWEKIQIILEDTRHLHCQEVKPWIMDNEPSVFSRIKPLLSISKLPISHQAATCWQWQVKFPSFKSSRRARKLNKRQTSLQIKLQWFASSPTVKAEQNYKYTEEAIFSQKPQWTKTSVDDLNTKPVISFL